MPIKAYEYYNGSRLIADYVGKVALDDVAGVSKRISYISHTARSQRPKMLE